MLPFGGICGIHKLNTHVGGLTIRIYIYECVMCLYTDNFEVQSIEPEI